MQPFRCTRCGYEWFPHNFDEQGRPIAPKKCPKDDCRSPYWNRPRLSKTERADLVRRRTKAYWRGRRAQ